MGHDHKADPSKDSQHGKDSKVQGEGDYEAARRYREETSQAAHTHDNEKEARAAAPRTAAEERELRKAENAGLAHSKGEDSRDAMKESVSRSLKKDR